MKPKIVFIVGPTAVGKTEIAVYLAKKINAEIISCDSMQIYKGMDIITSKPTNNLRKKVKHYLIDIISVIDEFNVSKYRREALKKIKEILKKEKIPIFVGGAGLYMSILIDGIFRVKTQNEIIRSRLYEQMEKFGSFHLYKRLQRIDPEAAIKIHPHDTKRIVRALEVFEITGKPITLLQKEREGLSQDYDIKIFCINMKREKLYERIDERIEKMFAKGIVSEVRNILKSRLSKTASYAIGIKEIKGYLDGQYDLEEAKRLMKRNTRLYAKRQLTWFRKDKRIKWINVSEREKPDVVVDKIWKKLY